MNEHTAVLLQGLANKLGTTSEYLWSILLKQAPVFATVALAQYVVTVVVMVLLWRFRVGISKAVTKGFEGDADILAFLGCAIFAIVSVGWLLACIFTFGNVVTAIVNPEYWALEKILDTVKRK